LKGRSNSTLKRYFCTTYRLYFFICVSLLGQVFGGGLHGFAQGIRATYENARDPGIVNPIVEAINSALQLPVTVTVAVGAVEGPPNYDPATRTITLPTAFIDRALEFESVGGADLIEFVLYHETGHALIDILEIPTESSEDTADALATLLAVEFIGGRERALLWGVRALAFELGEDAPYRFEQRRYFQIVCWVAGTNLNQFGDTARQAGIGETRLVRCRMEYEEMRENLIPHLATHLRY
jgi:hypothetical protein